MGRILINANYKQPGYKSWENMLSRCRNPRMTDYGRYGGRGISVCERWLSFSNFLADMGLRPSPRHSLDRYPNGDGNYEPGNCRWATPDEQLINRCNTIFLTIDGVTRPYIEWERESGLPKRLIYNRLIHGWSHEKAVKTPIGRYVKSGRYAAR